MLIDSFGRIHDNLRISVTDRCNIRCFYCMPEDNPVYVRQAEVLSFEEIERFARVAASLGVKKLRLTGGEPLVRRGLDTLVGMLTAIPGIGDIALTTNGLLLAEHAAALHAAGLDRINVHVDSLDRERFRQITRFDALEQVLEGIHQCKRLGYTRIKINAVAVRDLTELDVVPLAQFGREHGIEIRYIEFMPLDADGGWRRDKVLFGSEILDMLTSEIGPLEPMPDQDPRAPASEYRFLDGKGRVGIIASVSRPFCGSCNRLRVTADGKLRNCLFALDELDVRSILRGDGSDEAIAALIRRSIAAKWEGHEIHAAKFVQPSRPMHAIGG